MDTPTATIASQPEPSPAVVTSPEPVADSSSIADHAAQFDPRPPSPAPAENAVPESGQARDDQGRFTRHRAHSQRASVDDVPEINRLTKELRAKEAELAKQRPESGAESPRLKALKRQIKAIESELGELTPKTTPTPQPPTPPKGAAAESRPPVSAFTDKEPVLDDFLDQPDPYLAFVRAVSAYDRKKDAHAASEAAAKEQAQAAERQMIQAHNDRMTAFAAKTPDFERVITDLSQQILPINLLHAIVRDDKGPEFVYYLGQHPEVLADLVLQTDQRPLSEVSVAAVQRRLTQAVGSAQAAHVPDRPPVTPPYIPPRPPNPVRTGPIKTGDDPPGETASIAEHARHYGPRR